MGETSLDGMRRSLVRRWLRFRGVVAVLAYVGEEEEGWLGGKELWAQCRGRIDWCVSSNLPPLWYRF